MKQDRFLIAILVGIGVLVVAAFGLFFVRQANQNYVSDDIPAGVVHNYILALQRGDYDKAYGYLAAGEHKPSIENFRQPFALKYVSINETDVQVSETTLMNDEATVDLVITWNSEMQRIERYQNTERAILKKENNQWKIKQMPSPYWYYDWYQATPSK